MRNLSLILLGLLLGTAFLTGDSNAANASSNGGGGTCPQVMRLVAFVSEQTAYPPTLDCPRVLEATSEELRLLAALGSQPHGGEPLAMYLPAGAEILLSHEVDLSDPLGRSYLVHELVHAHQIANGVPARAPCLGWMEGEAYRVQADYLRIEGLTEDAFEVEILGLLQGACAYAYHPELILR